MQPVSRCVGKDAERRAIAAKSVGAVKAEGVLNSRWDRARPGMLKTAATELQTTGDAPQGVRRLTMLEKDKDVDAGKRAPF